MNRENWHLYFPGGLSPKGPLFVQIGWFFLFVCLFWKNAPKFYAFIACNNQIKLCNSIQFNQSYLTHKKDLKKNIRLCQLCSPLSLPDETFEQHFPFQLPNFACISIQSILSAWPSVNTTIKLSPHWLALSNIYLTRLQPTLCHIQMVTLT